MLETRRNYVYWMFAVIMICARVRLRAAPEMGVAARDAALGGAFTALADDTSAVYYNPAALINLPQHEFSSSYGFLNSGVRSGASVTDWSVSAGVPMGKKIGSAGVSWREIYEHSFYREQAASVGYGRSMIGHWSVGLGGQYFNRSLDIPVDAAAPEVDGGVASAYGVSVGVLGRVMDCVEIGFFGQGLNEPKRAASFVNRSVYRASAGYRALTYSVAAQLNNSQAAYQEGRNWSGTLAGEKWLFSNQFTKADIAVRGSISSGPDQWRQWAVGTTYQRRFLRMDYAFIMPFQADGWTSAQASHRLTLSVLFGRSTAPQKLISGKRNFKFRITKLKQKIKFHQDKMAPILAQVKSLRQNLVHQGVRQGDFSALYDRTMQQYWAQKDGGASLRERLEYLTIVTGFFRDYPVSISSAEKELASTQKSWDKIQKEWAESWSGYVLGNGEMDKDERLAFLADLGKRFESSGISMEPVSKELEILEELP